MKRSKIYLFGLLACLMAACGTDDLPTPSFLRVEGIRLEPPASGAIVLDSGFYLSDIRSAYITLRREGSRRLDTLGLFPLPFTTPVLYSGAVEAIEIFPAVRQNGQANALPYYTFYKEITRQNLTLAAADTLNLGTLTTTYDITQQDVFLFEPFEPTEGSLRFDSVMQWANDDVSNARSGRGYGYITVPDSVSQLTTVTIGDGFYLTDPAKLLYVEFDIRSEVELNVGLLIPPAAGGPEEEFSAVTVRPSEGWIHMYINLGRTRSQSNNYTSPFHFYMKALNVSGSGGTAYIDNVKIITTNRVL